jgi:hypothetical protein
MPAMVPNGRLAMCHAMVRRNCRVVMRHGLPPGPDGMTGTSGLPKAALRWSRKALSWRTTSLDRCVLVAAPGRSTGQSVSLPLARVGLADRRSSTAIASATGSIVTQLAASPMVDRRL